MLNKKINITCEPHLYGVIPNPVPAIKCAPSYFKAIPPQTNGNPKNGTAKRCVPFLDALSQGFIIPFWTDVFVRAVNGEITIDFPQNFQQEETLGTHDISQLSGHPLNDKPYGDILLKFINPWTIKTKPGISCLFTSPLNHLETRFKLVDGLVDTDTYTNQINFPFIWTGGDGEFFIQKGTPLVQVIPIRRESFDLDVHAVTEAEKKEQTIVQSALGTKLKNAYRDLFWHNRKKDKL